jgi:hypothetical protein
MVIPEDVTKSIHEISRNESPLKADTRIPMNAVKVCPESTKISPKRKRGIAIKKVGHFIGLSAYLVFHIWAWKG